MDAEMLKALEVMSLHEKTITEIITLAVEYEDAKSITAERFAARVVEIIRMNYKKLV